MRAGTRLVGRDDDVERVVATLRRAGRCTLVGPGGVGKSSVARAVTETGMDRPVVWIDAEPLADADVLQDQMLHAVGAERLPGQSPIEAVASALEGAAVLVVLDGVEHLGAALDDAALRWPSSPEGPWWLVTSRRPMGAALRPVLHLEPLATAALSTSPAAELMMQEIAARGGDAAATAVGDGFQKLVEATGGLPVAIQLTADHIARFGLGFALEQPTPTEEIVHRCIERTLGLLDTHEREVFERLGLTAGSFTIDVLAACDPGHPERTQRLAGRLVEHGLLLSRDARFDLLPPIRDGALALLDRRGATDRALAELIDHLLATTADTDGPGTLSVLSNNLDTVTHLAWLAVSRPDRGDRAVVLVHRLFPPMYERLRQRELLTLLEALLANERPHLGTRALAETARLAAICASECDTIPHARRWLDEAQALADHLQDPAIRAKNWSTQAWICLDVGDHAGAVSAAEHAMDADADNQSGVQLTSMRCIAEVSLATGALDRAEQVAGDVLRLADGPASFDGLLARTTLGWCLVERGRYAEAVSHARRLAADTPTHPGEVSEIAVEAELIATAADPGIRPAAPSLDKDQRFTWWMRLQQRVRRAAQLPIASSWEHVLHTAADVSVLADLVPLSYPRLCATILLADAALAGGDHRQAAGAYEQALRDAARAPNHLRTADALHGVAVLADRMGRHQLAGAAMAAATRIRTRAGAVAWPRPSLPATPPPEGTIPDAWMRNGALTVRAIDEIARTLRTPTRADPLGSLTHAERQIAGLVRQGMTNQQIADHLVISRRTVESHLSRIFRKLDLRTRTQLATLPADVELRLGQHLQ